LYGEFNANQPVGPLEQRHEAGLELGGVAGRTIERLSRKVVSRCSARTRARPVLVIGLMLLASFHHPQAPFQPPDKYHLPGYAIMKAR
jgi:hypothetical protein